MTESSDGSQGREVAKPKKKNVDKKGKGKKGTRWRK